MKVFTRRDFMKGSIAAGAGLTLASPFSCVRGADDDIRVAVVSGELVFPNAIKPIGAVREDPGEGPRYHHERRPAHPAPAQPHRRASAGSLPGARRSPSRDSGRSVGLPRVQRAGSVESSRAKPSRRVVRRQE